MNLQAIFEQIQTLEEEEQEWLAEQLEKLLVSIKKNQGIHNTPPIDKLYPEKLAYEIEDIHKIIAQFPPLKLWTFADLQNEQIFPPDLTIKIEIIKNRIYIMPKPTLTHQEIALNIATFINLYVLKNRLGKVYTPPISVKLDENNVVEPDILIVLLPKSEQLIANDKTIEGSPDIVVEVISKANYKKLRNLKKQMYANFGIEEYWEVYPKKKKIIIEALGRNEEGNNVYLPFSEAEKKGMVQSSVLEGFSLNIEDIFVK